MKNRIQQLSLAAIAVVSICVTQANAAGLLIADGGFGGVLKIKEQKVQVTINNGVAVTNIEQTFLNTEDRIVEALYTFPVPKGASVSNFSMWIGGKEMVGEVVEKKRARQIYESYKAKKIDPGLLEQVDFKRFEMRIFPIPAGAEQRVQITYYQELDFDHDWATYVYPLSTTSRDATADTDAGDFSLSLDVRSEVPIVEMKSPSHGDQVAVSEFDPQLLRASLETGATALNRDVVIAYKVKRPFTGVDVIGSKPSGEDGFLQMTMTVGEELERKESGMDYVFLLDVSGSMRSDSKLAVSEKSIAAFVRNLSQKDRFEIISFNDMPKAHFGSMTEVSDDTMRQAIDELNSLQARGGTSLEPAIEMAYRYLNQDRPLNVVVLSDGMTENRESQQLMQLIQSRPSGTRVFAIGIGNEVNRPLLNDIAQRTGGLAAFMSRGDDFERQAEAFRRKLLRPAIEDVKIRFANGVYDAEPLEAGSLYHGAPLRVYARYANAGPVDVTITGTIMGAEFSKTATVTLPDTDGKNPEIERMWAWHRVQRLLSEVRADGNNPAKTDEVVSLCEEFSIVSTYASFIVLENDAEYQRWQIQRRNLKRIGRDRAAQKQVRDQLEQLRSKSLSNLGPNAEAKPQRQFTSFTPTQSAPAQQVQPQPANQAAPVSRRQSSRGFDFTPSFGGGGGGRSGGGGGGGAIDPFTGLLTLGLGSMGWAARRRRKEDEDELQIEDDK